jgi:perosamine synthetase
MLPVYEPYLGDEEAENLAECIRTGWVSYLGPFVARFEADFREYVGSSNAVAVQSGTAALHLALMVLGVGEGDEVIMPDCSFAASAFPVKYVRGEPVFCDVDRDTWTIDPADARKRLTSKTRAIMPVHLFGHPCDMDPLVEFAEQEGLLVIEDAAQSLGAKYRGKHTGTFGHAGCFSFNGNKLVTSGGGGMIVFRDDAMAQRAFHLSTQARESGGRFVHGMVGYNYRMTNLQAAVGVAQLARIGKVIERHRKRTALYRKSLDGIAGLEFRKDASWAETNEWMFSFLLPENLARRRDPIIEELGRRNIMARPFFDSLSGQLPFRKGDVTVENPAAHDIASRGVNLPSSHQLTDKDIQLVCDTLGGIFGELK